MGLFSKVKNVISTLTDPIGGIGNFFGGDQTVVTDGTSSAASAVSPATALVNAGLAGLSAYSQDYFNRKAASRQYGYEKSLMDYQNEYNLPINQRKRLEDAGLNPNLLYGGSTVNTVSADGHAPNVRPAGIDLLAAYNLEAHNALLAQQIRLTDWNSAIAASKSLLTGRQASIAYYNSEYARREYETFKKTGKIPESYYKSMSMPQFLLRIFGDNLPSY